MAEVFTFPDGTKAQYITGADGRQVLAPVGTQVAASGREPMGALQTALVSAADSAMLGYLPQLSEALGGRSADDVRADLDASQAANPWSSTIGNALGYVVPGGAALKGAKFARGLMGYDSAVKAARVANPVLTNRQAVMAGTRAVAGNAAKGAGVVAAPVVAAGTGLTLSGMFGGQPSAPSPQTVNASDAGTAAGAQPESGRRSVNEYWADRMGVRPEDVAAIRQQYGGIPLFFAQELGKTRPASPDYKDMLGNLVVRQLEASAAAAEASGDQKQIDAVNEEIRRILNGDSL